MKLLSLDISSKCTGWSVWENGTLDGYGVIETKSKDGWGKRLTEFRESLNSVFEDYSPDSIVVENIYRGPSAISFKVLAFFHGVAYNIINEKLKCEPRLLSVSETRSLIGRPLGITCKSKEQAFHIMTETLGFVNWDFKSTNDIVDSFALAYGIFNQDKIKPSKELKYNSQRYIEIGDSKDGPVQDSRSKQGSIGKRSKKRISKAGSKISSGQESKQQRGRRKI
jgi:Holliday junction resolvasome RuvABC endonuclease subunit